MSDIKNDVPIITVNKAAYDGNITMKGFHYHDGYEIYYLVKGVRNYIIDGEHFTLNKGDVALIKPGVLHRTAGGAFERFLINFTKPYMEYFFTCKAMSILLSCFENKTITIPADRRTEIRILFEKIFDLLEDGKEEKTFTYFADVLNLLVQVSEQKNLSTEKITTEGKIVAEILNYINEHYNEIENITQISDNFFITKSHLCRIFKNVTGISVIEYLNRIKIKQSCYLLENTEKSITDICTECGFNSSVYFCKLFKKIMNITPTEFREQIKSVNHTSGKMYDGKHIEDVNSVWKHE